jgi:GT2 family glycosyltransferase
MKKIHVIVPCFHQNEAVTRSVRAVLLSEQVETHVLVIDIDSDGHWLHETWGDEPRLEWLVIAGHPGTGAALNRGIEKALQDQAELVFLLLPGDLVEPLTLKKLAGAATATGLATPRVLDPEGRIHAAGGTLSLLRSRAWLRGRDDRMEKDHGQPGKVAWCSLHGMMISCKALRSGARFHEDYFCSLEDVDFSVSMQKAGYSIIYVSQSVLHIDRIEQDSGLAGRKTIYYQTRNRVVLLMRHGNRRQKLAGFLYLTAATFGNALINILHGKRLEGRTRLIGLIDGMHQRMGPLRG